jgi:nicotinamide phosphoribosyltransferase
LQQLNRDTQKFAFKCSAARIEGEWRAVFKDPVTDPGKNSKHGRLALLAADGGFRTVENVSERGEVDDQLVTVFENGEITREYELKSIRLRAEVTEGV